MFIGWEHMWHRLKCGVKMTEPHGFAPETTAVRCWLRHVESGNIPSEIEPVAKSSGQVRSQVCHASRMILLLDRDPFGDCFLPNKLGRPCLLFPPSFIKKKEMK